MSFPIDNETRFNSLYYSISNDSLANFIILLEKYGHS